MVARVDGKGNAYVIWPTGTANIAESPPAGMALSKSTDGGRTWSSALSLPPSYDNARGGPANAYSQLAVTEEGSLHIVYNVNPKPDIANYSEVFHRASYDGGQTWAEPKSIGDAEPTLYAGQYFPNLSVAPNGRIDVAWFDTRDTPGMRSTDVYYAYSEDDGRTWSKNLRMTDATIDRNLGVYGSGYDIAGQVGIASTEEYAVIGWDDTRNSDPGSKANIVPGGGLQDIYIAAAQFEALAGGTSTAARYVLAAVVGLLAVGLILVLAAFVTRRGTAPAAAPASIDKAKTKVG